MQFQKISIVANGGGDSVRPNNKIGISRGVGGWSLKKISSLPWPMEVRIFSGTKQ